MGRNPPPGAIVDYVLAKPAQSPVRLEILDARGDTVRAFSSDDPPEELRANRYFPESWVRREPPPSATAGHHRFVWDLRYPRPRADRYEYSLSVAWGDDTPVQPRGPLAAPGKYTVRLTVDGKRSEQPLLLTIDPRVSAPPETLSRQLAFERELAASMDASFDALAWVRALRSQLAKRAEKAGSAGAAAEAMSVALGQARGLETGEAEAGRAGAGLASVNATLGAILTAADAVDAAPTATQSEGYASARSRLDTLLAAWRALSTDGLARLNAALRGAGIPEVTSGELERAPRSPESRAGTEIE
jgi:hypothetical protein